MCRRGYHGCDGTGPGTTAREREGEAMEVYRTDIYQCLQDDHRQVMALLDRIEATSDGQQRNEAFRELMSSLLPHAAGEETLVYPILRDQAGDAEEARRAVAEHHQARMLINQIAMMDCMDEQTMAKLKDLRQALQAHIAEEEGTIFAELRRVLSAKQAAEIARQFQEFKAQCHTEAGQINRRAA